MIKDNSVFIMKRTRVRMCFVVLVVCILCLILSLFVVVFITSKILDAASVHSGVREMYVNHHYRTSLPSYGMACHKQNTSRYVILDCYGLSLDEKKLHQVESDSLKGTVDALMSNRSFVYDVIGDQHISSFLLFVLQHQHLLLFGVTVALASIVILNIITGMWWYFYYGLLHDMVNSYTPNDTEFVTPNWNLYNNIDSTIQERDSIVPPKRKMEDDDYNDPYKHKKEYTDQDIDSEELVETPDGFTIKQKDGLAQRLQPSVESLSSPHVH